MCISLLVCMDIPMALSACNDTFQHIEIMYNVLK